MAGRGNRGRAALSLGASAWVDARIAGLPPHGPEEPRAIAGGWTHHAVPASGVARSHAGGGNEFLWLLAVPLLAQIPAFLLLWTILP